MCLLSLITVSAPALGAPSEVVCPEIRLSIQGGNYTLSKDFRVGSVLVYHCPTGYFPPVSTRRCQKTGEWNPPPSTSRRGRQCKLVTCPDPLAFQHGSVFPLQDKYHVNDTTTYECVSDYKLTGSPTRTCQANGKWSGSTPICSHNSGHCPDPGIPAGSRRTGNNFLIGDTVTYRCEDKLTLVGSSERTCQENGEWTGQEPECYYFYTFDTPEEISMVFGNSLETSLMTEMTGEQEGKKIKLAADANLHIYIALDGSDSIDVDAFNNSRQVIKKLIEQISFYEVTPKYDVVVFATEVTPIVNIRDYYVRTPTELFRVIEDLDKFDYNARGDDVGTDIAKAFHHIYSQMSWIRTQNETKFVNSSHVIIMFTDGEANMGGNPRPKIEQIKYLIQGNKPDSNNLDIYMFGVGDDIQKKDLNSFATKRPGEKHVFYVEDLDKLHVTFDKMLDESTSVGLCGLHKDYAFTGGTGAPLRHPWMAEIAIRHENGHTSNCMGSLVTPRFILTAAHCFQFEDTQRSVAVTLNSGKIPAVKNFKLHEGYNITAKRSKGVKEFYDYDVALIELAQDVKISALTRPVCIPGTKETSRALKLAGDDVTCKQQEDKLFNNEYEQALFLSPKKKMKHATIKLGKKTQPCFEAAKNVKGVTHYKELLTERFLCTGGLEPKTDDAACKGESGGALFLERNKRSIQVGVISWGVSDVCSERENKQKKSTAKHRDYHISLFKVQQFLKDHLTSLEFIDQQKCPESL
ncbi:hypothetical protein ACEWY4_026354 [Coilia grayii]|uniref:C3/C5 convertase n=1 Tax=Coilia grayii TaxID=363190 RepID=A0ABD1IVK8_9TELE